MKEEEMKEEEENKISDTCNLQKPTTRQATRPTSKLPHHSDEFSAHFLGAICHPFKR